MKTREWIMVIFIVILVQFLIQGAAWIYGGNQSALGYVSFAGTLISIILAVLAIVYSFVQSVTQQNSSNTISKQVDKLISVTDNVNRSETELNKSLGKLQDVSQTIEQSLNEQKLIHTSVRTIDQKVDVLKEELLSNIFSSKNLGNSNLVTSSLEQGHNGLRLCSLILYYGDRYSMSIDKIKEELLPPIWSDMDWTENEKTDMVQNFHSQTIGTFYCFCAFGIASDFKNRYELSSDFKKVCNEFVDKSKQGDDEILKHCIEVFESYSSNKTEENVH